jgi:hypothetical protein
MLWREQGGSQILIKLMTYMHCKLVRILGGVVEMDCCYHKNPLWVFRGSIGLTASLSGSWDECSVSTILRSCRKNESLLS